MYLSPQYIQYVLFYLRARIVYTFSVGYAEDAEVCVCVFVCGKDVASTTQGQPGVKGSLTHSC